MGKEVSSLTPEATPLLILQPVAVFFVFRSKVPFSNILQINLKIIKKSLKNDNLVIYYTNNKVVKNKQKYSKKY